MSMENKGLTAHIYGVNVAVEHNPDGSVTICKEVVDDLLALKTLPASARRILTRRSDIEKYGKVQEL